MPSKLRIIMCLKNQFQIDKLNYYKYPNTENEEFQIFTNDIIIIMFTGPTKLSTMSLVFDLLILLDLQKSSPSQGIIYGSSIYQ